MKAKVVSIILLTIKLYNLKLSRTNWGSYMKLLLFYLLTIITFLIFLSCSSESFVNLNSLKEELKLKDFPGQKDFPEADAVVLNEVYDVNVKINDDYEYEANEKVKNVIKLFKNIDTYASVEIPIANIDKISDLRARTIKPDGSITELNDNDFHTIAGNSYGYTFYTDNKTIRFTFPSIEKNCIIEYDYTLDKINPSFEEEWPVQSEIPKLQTVYKLTAPLVLINKGNREFRFGLKYKSYNCPVSDLNKYNDSVISYSDKSISFNWKQKNIPAFEPDPMMPPHSNYLRYIEIVPSKWEHWNDFSDWYYNHLYKSRLIITEDVSNKAKELTKGCTNEIDKIRCIYKFVQKMRYVAIELGKSGRIPATPQEVLIHNYGDCKDKSTLLVALLKSIGIMAKPVLVLTSNEGHIDREFPTGKFNHMIVKALTMGGKDFWLDATIEHCGLGVLASDCQNIDVLVLNDDGTSQIETTPNSTCNDNVEDISMKINFSNADSTIFNILIKYKGEFNIERRDYFFDKTREEMIKLCKSLVSDNYLKDEVLDYSLNNIDSTDLDLELKFRLNVPNIIKRQGDFSFLNIDPFQLSAGWNWLGSDKRKYDIEVNYPYTIKKSIEVNLPNNKYNIRNLPSNLLITDSSFFYSKEYQTLGNNKFIINEDFSIAAKDINVSDFFKVRKFIDQVKLRQNERIILTSQ